MQLRRVKRKTHSTFANKATQCPGPSPQCTCHQTSALSTHVVKAQMLTLSPPCHCFCRALKSIIAESYGPVGQAKVIGYTTAGYSIGAIAGPIIGGVLAVPCHNVLSNSSLCNQGAWLLDRYRHKPRDVLLTVVLMLGKWCASHK